jgi:CheY-like chemotaxis protein
MIAACRCFRIIAVVVCLTVSGAADVAAQNDPFRPTAEPPAETPAADAGTAEPPANLLEIVRDNPVIDALLTSNPETPFELVRTVDLLLDLNRDDLAGSFVQQLLNLQLTDEQSYDLYKQAGSAVIFRIGDREALRPAGEQLARNVLDAANRYASDAERIRTLAESVVRTEDKYQRSLALGDLRLLGDTGAAVLIEKLADPAYEVYWPRIRQAVQLFGDAAEGPLMAALRSNSLKLRVEALYLLRYLKSPVAVESLMAALYSVDSSELQRKVAAASLEKISGRVPEAGECQERLYRAAHRYLLDTGSVTAGDEELRKWWRWDAGMRSFVPTWLTRRTVERTRAFGRAQDLVRLDPDMREYRLLYWVARLETAKLTGGLSRPLPASVLASFVEQIGDDSGLLREVLDLALTWKRIPAAIAACEIIGNSGQHLHLQARHGTVSPLVRALTFGSLRLTAAAAEAIFRIDPAESFSGSSDYLASLVYLSRSTGSKTALVGHVDLETAQSLSALTSRRGYVGRPEITSRGLFEQANHDPDLQLILITDRLPGPGYSELVQTLRSNPRTSRIPILLMVDPARLDRADRLAERYRDILVSPLVVNERVIARQIDNLEQGVDYVGASQPERAEYAVRALQYLAHYASHPERYPFFDVLNQQERLLGGLASPARAADTCQVLGQLGTADAQSRLLEMVNNLQLPISLRRVAADSFAVAVRKRGLMLSRQQILRQYDRYNASAGEPAASQQILADVLDVLERRPPRRPDVPVESAGSASPAAEDGA